MRWLKTPSPSGAPVVGKEEDTFMHEYQRGLKASEACVGHGGDVRRGVWWVVWAKDKGQRWHGRRSMGRVARARTWNPSSLWHLTVRWPFPSATSQSRALLTVCPCVPWVHPPRAFYPHACTSHSLTLLLVGYREGLAFWFWWLSIYTEPGSMLGSSWLLFLSVLRKLQCLSLWPQCQEDFFPNPKSQLVQHVTLERLLISLGSGPSNWEKTSVNFQLLVFHKLNIKVWQVN